MPGGRSDEIACDEYRWPATCSCSVGRIVAREHAVLVFRPFHVLLLLVAVCELATTASTYADHLFSSEIVGRRDAVEFSRNFRHIEHDNWFVGVGEFMWVRDPNFDEPWFRGPRKYVEVGFLLKERFDGTRQVDETVPIWIDRDILAYPGTSVSTLAVRNAVADTLSYIGPWQHKREPRKPTKLSLPFRGRDGKAPIGNDCGRAVASYRGNRREHAR